MKDAPYCESLDSEKVQPTKNNIKLGYFDKL